MPSLAPPSPAASDRTITYDWFVSHRCALRPLSGTFCFPFGQRTTLPSLVELKFSGALLGYSVRFLLTLRDRSPRRSRVRSRQAQQSQSSLITPASKGIDGVAFEHELAAAPVCGKSWRRTGAINHCTSFALWCRSKRAKGCIGAAGASINDRTGRELLQSSWPAISEYRSRSVTCSEIQKTMQQMLIVTRRQRSRSKA